MLKLKLLLCMGLLLSPNLQDKWVILGVIPNPEFGKCYISYIKDKPSDAFNDDPFILEIIPALLEDTVIHDVGKELAELEVTRVCTQEEYGYFEVRNDFLEERSLSHYRRYKKPFAVCHIKHPARYKTYTKEDLQEINYTIVQKKRKSNAIVVKTYVRERPNVLSENQYYFEGGDWSRFEEMQSSSGCGGGRLIWRVQKALKDLGYDVELNDENDEKTKKALTKYQKKNKLPVGNLNIKTLKKLGVY